MDFAEFNAMHMPALERDEARHNLILAIMEMAAGQDPPGQTRNWSLGKPGACAVQTQGRGLVLGEPGRDHCRALAEEVAGTRFISVVGPDQAPLWFVERATELGERFKEPMPQRIHAVSEPPRYPGVPGEAREMTIADAELFAKWGTAFAVEATPEEQVPAREQMDRRSASGNQMLWLADGEPVSTAGIVRRTRGTASIAWVYTPPESRGRGYAGAVTAAVVEKIYAEGRKTACLYTDQRNPASNRCYARIGFKPVCESWFFPQVLTEPTD